MYSCGFVLSRAYLSYRPRSSSACDVCIHRHCHVGTRSSLFVRADVRRRYAWGFRGGDPHEGRRGSTGYCRRDVDAVMAQGVGEESNVDQIKRDDGHSEDLDGGGNGTPMKEVATNTESTRGTAEENGKDKSTVDGVGDEVGKVSWMRFHLFLSSVSLLC